MDTLERLEAVRFDVESGELVILDQTLLPNRVEYLRLKAQRDIWQAIRLMRVRGAPATGIAAGYGIYLAVRYSRCETYPELLEEFSFSKKFLESSRPASQSLSWALDRMERRLRRCRGLNMAQIKNAMLAEADAIETESVSVCRRIGESGLDLLCPGMGILTHCNAGWLGAGRYGTALAPVYFGHAKGYGFKVYVNETRPLLQGARLTAFELERAGIDTTLLCDSAASMVMQRKWAQAVVVGCERMAANGDIAGTIGTSGLAVLARHHGIPFYVFCPASGIDMTCPDGGAVEMEERLPGEVTELWFEKPMAPEGAPVLNHAFDVTEQGLISAIVTEYGVTRPPYGEALARLFAE